jgi:hypothetical protein
VPLARAPPATSIAAAGLWREGPALFKVVKKIFIFPISNVKALSIRIQP